MPSKPSTPHSREMNRLRVREHRLRKRIAEGKDPIPMDKWEACMPGVAARQAKRAALWREQQAKAAAAQAPAEATQAETCR